MIQYSKQEDVVRRNDIVLADNGRLAIVDNVVEQDKGIAITKSDFIFAFTYIAITFLDNGFQCYIKIKQSQFVNHNTEKAAKMYRDLVKNKKH